MSIREESRLTILVPKKGLNYDIRDKFELLPYNDFNDLVQLCVRVEERLKRNLPFENPLLLLTIPKILKRKIICFQKNKDQKIKRGKRNLSKKKIKIIMFLLPKKLRVNKFNILSVLQRVTILLSVLKREIWFKRSKILKLLILYLLLKRKKKLKLLRRKSNHVQVSYK